MPHPPPPKTANPTTGDISHRATRGSVWYLGGGAMQAMLRLGASAILARILMPEDFGLYAMAMLVIGLLQQLNVLGAGAGIIAKKKLTNEDIGSGFILAASINFAMAAVAAGLAAQLASWLKMPEATEVIRLLSLTFLFAGISSIHQTLMVRRMQFGTLVKIGMISLVVEISTCIFLAAYADFGVMALAWGNIAGAFVTCLLRLGVVGKIPIFCYSTASFRFLLRYGLSSLWSALVLYIRMQLDQLIIGRFLGATSLGYYSLGGRMPQLIRNRLAIPSGGTVLPSLAQVQDSDDLLDRGYRKSARYLAVLTFPLLVGLSACAEPLVRLLWGERWLPAVPLLRIICATTAIQCIAAPIGSLFLVRKRPELAALLNTLMLPITIAILAAATWYGGMTGAATGGFVATFISYLLTGTMAFRLINRPFSRVALDLAPLLTATALCGGAAWTMIHFLNLLQLPDALQLAAAIPTGALAFLLGLYCFARPFLSEFSRSITAVAPTAVKPFLQTIISFFLPEAPRTKD